ncbi:MAG: T9SS type A sorting domain-containing protein [candidate division WOR-3 bacterium]
MNFSGVFVVVGLLILSVTAEARTGFPDFALKESLARVHPRMRAPWLRERGIDDPHYSFKKLASTGLRCIGRWPWGPSWELCGRDSLLFLGSGSGVRILSISDSIRPQMLGHINARGLISQLAVKDTLLYVACGNFGAQIYNISNPANPRELGSMDAVIYDLAVVDTLCYTVGSKYPPNDSLRIYNVADPAHPVEVGAVCDSGNVLIVANGYAFVAGNVTSMNVYDVRNPVLPNWINSRGGHYLTLFPRENLLFCSGVQPDYFSVLDISNPGSITEIGRINGYGGWALYVDDYFAYLSCTYEHQGLYIIDITDSTRPQLRGSINPEGDNEWDFYVPQPLSYGYLAADYGGLVVIDLHNVNAPTEVWSGYKAHQAMDVHLDNSRCYVAEQCAGLRILDVTDPSNPQDLGEYDTIGVLDVRSATARDSFAFITYWGNRRRFLRVLDVTDPLQPIFAAEESCFNPPMDIVLRDSFLYLAEANRFQVVNIARPRQPRLVGSGVIQGTGVDLLLCETLAYVSSLPTQILNVRDPANPALVGTIPTYGHGIAIRDTFAFVPALYDSMVIYNISNPTAPVRVARHTFSGGHVWNSGVTLVDTLLYVGGDLLHILDISDPFNPREVGIWVPPYDIRRLVYAEPYLYAACYEAGICVLETVQVGVKENQGTRHQEKVSVVPSITSGVVWFIMDGGLEGTEIVEVYNPAGIKVKEIRERNEPGWKHIKVDLSKYPAGVYIVRLRAQNKVYNSRVVKTKGR